MKTRTAIHWTLYIILFITILSFMVTPKAWMVVLAIGIVLYVRHALNTKTEGD
jgi:energy-converting hydrogenase Eha subunit G